VEWGAGLMGTLEERSAKPRELVLEYAGGRRVVITYSQYTAAWGQTRDALNPGGFVPSEAASDAPNWMYASGSSAMSEHQWDQAVGAMQWMSKKQDAFGELEAFGGRLKDGTIGVSESLFRNKRSNTLGLTTGRYTVLRSSVFDRMRGTLANAIVHENWHAANGPDEYAAANHAWLVTGVCVRTEYFSDCH
jgi:hypothetical protein